MSCLIRGEVFRSDRRRPPCVPFLGFRRAICRLQRLRLNSIRIIYRNRSPHLQIDVAAALAEALICGDQWQKGSSNRSFPLRYQLNQ